MQTKINTTISLMGQKVEVLIDFNNYGFCVSADGFVVDGGCFSYNGEAYFTETKRYVELFSDALHKRVIKEMKREKEAWAEMVKYQNSK